MRHKILGLVMAVVLGTATMAWASSEGAALSADDALKMLMDGNSRYVAGKLTNSARSGADARAALATSQKPYAVILSCSDSRLPPEIIFDKGLGEIFVVRVAGNVPDPVVLGSIEYAVEHLGSPLVVVLGHERCGAVKATVAAHGKTTGSKNIDAIAREIGKSAAAAAKECPACQSDKLCAEHKAAEFAASLEDANAKSVAASLTKKSAILQHLAKAGKIKIVAAKYDLDDGVVTVFK